MKIIDFINDKHFLYIFISWCLFKPFCLIGYGLLDLSIRFQYAWWRCDGLRVEFCEAIGFSFSLVGLLSVVEIWYFIIVCSMQGQLFWFEWDWLGARLCICLSVLVCGSLVTLYLVCDFFVVLPLFSLHLFVNLFIALLLLSLLINVV